MTRLVLTALAVLPFVPPTAIAEDYNRPIPQNPERQERQYRDLLEWHRRTLGGAYEKVGKKDPRWDKPAREAMEAMARIFARATDPVSTHEEIYAAGKKAVDAGCDDPLLLYLYTRSSSIVDRPDLKELERRVDLTADAMGRSRYPAFRRAIAAHRAGNLKLQKTSMRKAGGLKPDDGSDAEDRKAAASRLESALAFLAESFATDPECREIEAQWLRTTLDVVEAYRLFYGDYQKAFDKVDGVLAKVPAAKETRLRVRGNFYVRYAWEARGHGTADTVSEENWKKFAERLKAAHEAATQLWALKPGDHSAAALMVVLARDMGFERPEMEKWFERAMESDGNDMEPIDAKMSWVSPMYYGSEEESIAFGRACRATKNWRAGITLVLGDVHWRTSLLRPAEEREAYFKSPEVWRDMHDVYEEYLSHFSADHERRSLYAVFCYLCGKFAESDKQFKILGKHLEGSPAYSEEQIKEVRSAVEHLTRPPGPPAVNAAPKAVK